MSNIELLSPAGDFECLVSAVQNGANAVYFGLDKFNARVNGRNFEDEELVKAIKYAKLRNVKTHLTLNILIKNKEFEEALKLVEFAYNSGIDAVIVQDLGLAKKIMELFPKLEVHSSTQMTIYNLDGVKEIEKLGYSRCVLARELSIEEIKNICKNTNIEIEVFIHGALCICYSGQCLMSSLIGGRSGNRGKCAGTCRLPYSLLKDGQEKEKGYLLSSKDVCTLDILPELIEAGVKSFKIEGRMKSKEYVGIVTSIYRKYIDLAESNQEYLVDEKDREMLMQIFNRGGFSTGYLKGKLGKNMMYTKRPNHIGTLLGEVISYNPNKGHVKIKLCKELDLGDSIAIGDSSCKISELMQKNNNIKIAKTNDIVTIGRIKGKIKPKDKVYKTVSIKLNQEMDQKIGKENIKRKVNCNIELKQDETIKLELQDMDTNISVKLEGDSVVKKADNAGITSKRIEEQLSKTGNTIFKIENINIKMDESIIVPISSLNEIRRRGLEELEHKLLESFEREQVNLKLDVKEEKFIPKEEVKVTLCLNKISKEIDYASLKNVDNVYIPFKYFLDEDLKESIENISKKFSTYILLPAITKSNYEKLLYENLPKIAERVEGIVISNLSQIYEIEKLGINGKKLVANYTMNIEKETIVYGRTLLMTTEYCSIGTLKNCPAMCQKGRYTLKDRMGFEFPIYTDRINCNNLIYNSKITSISYKDLQTDSIKIDILEETREEIQRIIDIQKRGERLEGQDYTNGNLNREI